MWKWNVEETTETYLNSFNVYNLQLEGGKNPMIHKIQHEGSFNSLDSLTATGRRLQALDYKLQLLALSPPCHLDIYRSINHVTITTCYYHCQCFSLTMSLSLSLSLCHTSILSCCHWYTIIILSIIHKP